MRYRWADSVVLINNTKNDKERALYKKLKKGELNVFFVEWQSHDGRTVEISPTNKHGVRGSHTYYNIPVEDIAPAKYLGVFNKKLEDYL